MSIGSLTRAIGKDVSPRPTYNVPTSVASSNRASTLVDETNFLTIRGNHIDSKSISLFCTQSWLYFRRISLLGLRSAYNNYQIRAELYLRTIFLWVRCTQLYTVCLCTSISCSLSKGKVHNYAESGFRYNNFITTETAIPYYLHSREYYRSVHYIFYSVAVCTTS